MKSADRISALTKFSFPPDFTPTTELHKTLKKQGIDPWYYVGLSDHPECKHILRLMSEMLNKHERRALTLDDMIAITLVPQEQMFGMIQVEVFKDQGKVGGKVKPLKKINSWLDQMEGVTRIEDVVRLVDKLLGVNAGKFHEVAIQKNIRAIEEETGFKTKESGIDEAVEITEHFQGITHKIGKKVVFKREGETPEEFVFTDHEEWMITNELYLCACSFPYWFYRYFYIKDPSGNIGLPEELVAQQVMMDIMSESDLGHLPILVINLKARQLGISTFHIGVILWTAIFRRGSHCVLASAEESKSLELADKAWLALENLPLFMQHVLTREDIKVGPEFGSINSDILIQHGSQKKGISRGSTPVAALISEVPYYFDPIETIESSLLRAMHENPRTYLILEGTARKRGDWYHETWLKNREGEDTGYNRFACLFLPWYVGSDKYPTVDWMKNHPIPQNWIPLKQTLKQATDAQLYVRSTPLLSKYLGSDWVMPIEQQWFWEFNFRDASISDAKLKSFYAEMAADERSAFQSKKWSVYRQDTLDKIEAEASKKFTDYAMAGDGIDSKFTLREFWSLSARRIDIGFAGWNGKNFNWKLIPLKRTPEDENLNFYLRVWEPPKPGYEYAVGIDVSGGVGQDNSSFTVIRKGKGLEPDVQVAELYSPWISSAEAPPFAMLLGVWYGQHMSPIPQALMCPEVQAAVGDIISHQLDALGYQNFYYMERMDLKRKPGQRSQRRGWASTTTWARQAMLETYKLHVESGWIILNSENTILEMQNQEAEETDSGKTKYDHAHGQHDDSIFSTGIAFFCLHFNDTLMEKLDGGVLKKRGNPKKLAEIEKPDVSLDSPEAMLARRFQWQDREESGVVSDNDADSMTFVY
jgi:hypothetical protein